MIGLRRIPREGEAERKMCIRDRYYPYLKKARSAPAHSVHGTVARQVDGIFIAQLNCPRTCLLYTSRCV